MRSASCELRHVCVKTFGMLMLTHVQAFSPQMTSTPWKTTVLGMLCTEGTLDFAPSLLLPR